MGAPVLFTSVPPETLRIKRGIEVGASYQRECVESWVAAGFRVISVNSVAEIDDVRALNLPLEVRAVQSEEGSPSIASIVGLASVMETSCCGIINADCMMLAGGGFAEKVATSIDNSLHIAERVDLDETGGAVPGNCAGFDVFFFRPTEICRDLDTRLKMGDPWWDYWFPCVAALHGLSIHRIQTPILTHLTHPTTWDRNGWFANGHYFCEQLAAQTQDEKGNEIAEFIGTLDLKNADLSEVSIAVHRWLRGRPEGPKFNREDDPIFPAANLLMSLREFHAVDAPELERQLQYLRGNADQLGLTLDRVRKAFGHGSADSQQYKEATADYPYSQTSIGARAAALLERWGSSHPSVSVVSAQLADWVREVRPRGFVIADTLVSLALISALVPLLVPALLGVRWGFWTASAAFITVASILCVKSFLLFTVRSKHELEKAVKTVHQSLERVRITLAQADAHSKSQQQIPPVTQRQASVDYRRRQSS